MDLAEPTTHSFIVKIWLEETSAEAGHVVWRGHITHVPGDERRYVHDLRGITLFIAPYLETMGVRLEAHFRVQRWLRRWRWFIGGGRGEP